MNISKKSLLIVASLIFAAGLVACDKPGPAEKAGRSIDQATEKAGDKLDETSKKLGDQSDKAGEAFDDTAITAKVKAAILAEPGLRVLQISVVTKERVVALSGSVDSHKDSDRAKEVAGAVAGVKWVENRLAVKTTN